MRHFTVLIHFYSCCVPVFFSCVGVWCYICSWMLCVRLRLMFWIIFCSSTMGNYLEIKMRKLDWMFIINDVFWQFALWQSKQLQTSNFPHYYILVNKWRIDSLEQGFFTFSCHENRERSEAHGLLFGITFINV